MAGHNGGFNPYRDANGRFSGGGAAAPKAARKALKLGGHVFPAGSSSTPEYRAKGQGKGGTWAAKWKAVDAAASTAKTAARRAAQPARTTGIVSGWPTGPRSSRAGSSVGSTRGRGYTPKSEARTLRVKK